MSNRSTYFAPKSVKIILLSCLKLYKSKITLNAINLIENKSFRFYKFFYEVLETNTFIILIPKFGMIIFSQSVQVHNLSQSNLEKEHFVCWYSCLVILLFIICNNRNIFFPYVCWWDENFFTYLMLRIYLPTPFPFQTYVILHLYLWTVFYVVFIHKLLLKIIFLNIIRL